MSLYLMTSIAGAPGVSTAALGITLSWPGPSMLVDTDVQQHALAGIFAGSEAPEPNLANLAITAARRGSDVGESIWTIARRLPGDAEPNRRLLVPGPATPWAKAPIERQWGSLVPALQGLGRTTGLDVFVDLGRLMAPSTPTPVLVPAALLEGSAAIMVVIEPTLQGIAAARVMLQGLAEQVAHSVTKPLLALVLREPARAAQRFRREAATAVAYSAREISKETGLPVIGTLVHDTDGAIRLNQGKDWDKTRLAKNLNELARSLQQHTARHTTTQELGDL